MNIQPGFLTLAELRELHSGSHSLTIDPTAAAGILTAQSWCGQLHKAASLSMA